ncbi:MAG: RluA family pseudouridine synthase [Bacteroidetes bacterium]|nr:RluA family pseudouridine synthase [Bacteroidota bacterium]MBU1421956.1 RluA family pseudouridine synthase [Bacteroidota bacterium]MBU2636998.1 RluA family pseudouridine synthase [Bacteroidota bacterium]
MPRQSEIVVPPGKIRERLDVFLTHSVENATRTKVQEAIEAGLVLVNGKPTKASYRVSPNDVINITIPQPKRQEVVAENIPINIIYEDEFLIVVNKPAGMVTHPAYGNYTGTLVNALLYHCNGKLSSANNITRAGIVHRLDKDTSGLMVVAKDDSTHAKLAKQFSQRTVEREYWAIVWGVFKKNKKGIIETNLGRSKSDRKKITVTEDGKHAITEYEVVDEFDYLSLIRLKLRTGRTHQIRVHLHHIGHPVFGDPTYGGRKIAYGSTDKKRKEEVHELLEIIPRQALHAKTLGFIHPLTNKKMSLNSKIPDDMREVLEMLRGDDDIPIAKT